MRTIGKIKKKLGLAVFIGSLIGVFYLKEVRAEEEAMFERVGFTVRTKLPDNQIDKSNSYFYLKTTPGLKQTVEIEVINTSQIKRQIQAELNTAMTNSNGVIDYAVNEAESDTSLSEPITEIATIRNKVIEVEAGKKESLFIDLVLPAHSFTGIILGGITFSEAENQSSESNGKGVSMASQYAYTVGMMLTEGDELLDDNLNLLGVEAGVIEGRKAIQATIQNDQAKIVRGVAIEAELFKKGSTTVLREQSQSEIELAPNSSFPFSLLWGKQPLESGSYVLKMHAKTDDDQWEWDEAFEVTADDAKKANQVAVDKVILPMWLKYTTVILIALAAMTHPLFIWKVKRLTSSNEVAK